LDNKACLNELLNVLLLINIEAKTIRETKNGYHILVPAFDSRLLLNKISKEFIQSSGLEVKNDSYVFVEYIEANNE